MAASATRSSIPSVPTIVEVIDAAGPLWFPGLAETLAARFDIRVGTASASRYRTSRWIGAMEAASGEGETIAIGRRTALMENLAAPGPQELSVVPARWREGDGVHIKTALALLDQVDGLTATLAPLVRAIHRLDAEADYDISHSDPALPYSIFVSIPSPGATGAVRLAESILHEAMHLQLSLIEAEVRLVTDDDQRAWSPWQARDRPAQGLLHGLYVFAVIFAVLERFEDAPPKVAPDADTPIGNEQPFRDHVRRRRRQIAEEVRTLTDFAASLEPAGERLRQRCLEAVLVGV